MNPVAHATAPTGRHAIRAFHPAFLASAHGLRCSDTTDDQGDTPDDTTADATPPDPAADPSSNPAPAPFVPDIVRTVVTPRQH